MNIDTKIGIDLLNIAECLFVSFVGLIAIAVSLFRLKSKDFSLLNFGLFCFLYGIRWLCESAAMATALGFPFTVSYFHTLLTYILPIPLSAFLYNVFGRGLYNSIIWFFRSTIIYAIGAVVYDLLLPGPSSGASISPVVVFIWCMVGIVNLIFVKGERQHELRVLRGVFFFVFLCVANDNFVSLHLVPWNIRLEHFDIIVLCLGLGYIAVRLFFTREKQLLVIEQELTIARQIQRSNLPDNCPDIPPLSIAARYIPLTAVAGDFYDFQTKGGNGLGILIADVSGHGVGAALVSSMLKIAFASQFNNLEDPAYVLMEINRILQGKIEDSFVTACALYLDRDKGTLRYANAGHPPPMMWRRSAMKIIRLARGNIVLGPFPDIVYQNEELILVEEDRLLLYTDGLTEIRNKRNQFFGENGVEKLLETHSSDSVDFTADHILEHLYKWSGRSHEISLDDDLTFIILDVVSMPAVPVSA